MATAASKCGPLYNIPKVNILLYRIECQCDIAEIISDEEPKKQVYALSLLLMRQGRPERHSWLWIHHLLCVLVTQSCLTLCYLIDCSPPGSSVHGISQVRKLVWLAISFSRGSSGPRDGTHVSCLAGRLCTTESPGQL